MDHLENLIELEHLEFAYPSSPPSLRDLTFSVGNRKKLALLGANGAGKTTLFLHLNGTLRPHRGQIKLRGDPVSYSRSGLLAWRQSVALVLQNPDDQLFAGTVYEDVSFGPLNLGRSPAETRERIAEALCLLGIEGLSDRPIHALSGGQKKKVAIAGAVAMHPDLLILDEPTAGLDPCGTEQLLETLETLQRAGITLLLSTHDMEIAYRWADEVAILGEGTILAQGSPEVVLRDEPLLASCRLRMPWVLDLASALARAGRWRGPWPRTREELLSALLG